MKKRYIVETHLGAFETWATSPKKAIANVRFRLAGRQTGFNTDYWTVREVAS